MNDVMLITGARKGIGRYLAEYYVQRGYVVEGCSRKAPDWTLEGYTHHCVDVTDEAQVRDMLNNAGIASMNHAMLTPMSVAQKIISTNFLGTFLMCRESAKLMAQNKFGRIVNFSTIAVPLQLEGEALYASAKSAVETLTRILAREFAELGITSNAIGPTPIPTDLIRAVPQDKMDALIDRLALRRPGCFEDVSNVVDFFISRASDSITGQVLYLGGVS
jgi:3-oxoacyl-[acyl-carrier protein] reductase